MRKFLIILLGIVGLAFLVAVSTSFDRDLSDADRKLITALVQKETTESILKIEQQGDGTVQVFTGVQRGPLDGGGKLFTLKLTFRGWKIVHRDAWMS